MGIRKRFDVDIPDGQHLGLSRDTDGAFRAHLFDDETNDLVGHAELFEPDEIEADSPNDQYVYVFDSRPSDRDEVDEELAEALGALVALGIIVAAAAAPHVKRLWHDKGLPVIRSTRNRIKATWHRIPKISKADSQVATAELITQGAPAPADSSEEVDAALDGLRASMSSAEARQRFVAALMATAFSEEQMRMLRNARIEDDEGPLGLTSALKALTPQQVGDTIYLMLESDPSLLDRETLVEFGRLLGGGRIDGEYVPLRDERVRKVLRLTSGLDP